MRITPRIFGAYLKCPTKSFLLAQVEAPSGNAYAEWVRNQNESYRSAGVARLKERVPPEEWAGSTPDPPDLKAAKWRLAVDFQAQAHNLESRLHAVERVPSAGRGKPAQFIPIRFVFTNKLTKDDKLMLAFDTLVLSEMLGREVSHGKIIHGDDGASLRVKSSALAPEVRKLNGRLSELLATDLPPELVLNRHCAECEFQGRCRQKAVEVDDLSLLSAMTKKERNRYRSKGIFTVKQLSYTFRPRRTPKRAKNPAKAHYVALQALAIRERTIYIHGSPQLHEAKTRVYMDIEGLPDSEFYYLVGALFVGDGKETFQSFWADQKSDETRIFAQFVEAVCQRPDFRVFHFGNYESVALKHMKARLPECLRLKIDEILERATNVLSVVHPHVYFPTYSKWPQGHRTLPWI